jgi:hypothetical protein
MDPAGAPRVLLPPAQPSGPWRIEPDAGRLLTPAYPFWSLMIIAVDVVALYGLCVYGSRENLAA